MAIVLILYTILYTILYSKNASLFHLHRNQVLYILYKIVISFTYIGGLDLNIICFIFSNCAISVFLFYLYLFKNDFSALCFVERSL